MDWVVLIASGVLEAVWAIALSRSKGFTKRNPTIVFLIGLVLSLAGLSWAMLTISTGTAYAVWVGIGASLTVLWGFVSGDEKVTIARSALIVLLVASVVGLKVVS